MITFCADATIGVKRVAVLGEYDAAMLQLMG